MTLVNAALKFGILERRSVLMGLLGLSASLTVRPLNARCANAWIPHEASVDGSPESFFAFGTLDRQPAFWQAHNCGHPYSCQLSGDGRLLRLELRSDDRWPDDLARGSKVERTMVQAVSGKKAAVSRFLPMYQDVWWAFSFLVEPGPPVMGPGPHWDAWLILADIHSDYGASHAHAVPIQFQLDAGDIFNVQLHGTNLFPENTKNEVYRAVRPFERGTWHDLVTRINMDPTPATKAGGADVYLDGEQIVSYRGPVGFPNDKPYAQFQLYRGIPDSQIIVPETSAIRYAHSEIVTSGDLAPRVSRPPRPPAAGDCTGVP